MRVYQPVDVSALRRMADFEELLLVEELQPRRGGELGVVVAMVALPPDGVADGPLARVHATVAALAADATEPLGAVADATRAPELMRDPTLLARVRAGDDCPVPVCMRPL